MTDELTTEHDSRSCLREHESHSPLVGECQFCRFTRYEVNGHWVARWLGCDRGVQRKEPATQDELERLEAWLATRSPDALKRRRQR